MSVKLTGSEPRASIAVFCPIRKGTEVVAARACASMRWAADFVVDLYVWRENPTHPLTLGASPNVVWDGGTVEDALERFFYRAQADGNDWGLLLFPSDQWPAADHVAVRAAWNFPSLDMARADPESLAGCRDLSVALDAVAADVNVCLLSTMAVEDQAGQLCRAHMLETRLVRLERGHFGAPAEGEKAFHLPQFPIVFQFLAGWHLEQGDLGQAMAVAGGAADGLSRRIYLQARTERDTREALKAFEVLFQFYSRYEELAGLDELMKNLPYTFEGRPEVAEWERLLALQTQLLKDPRDAALPIQERRWDELGYYAHRAPVMTSANESTFNTIYAPQTRSVWLGKEVKERGYKRVVEIGGSDGINLSHLVRLYPDVEWVGLDVSDKCVDNGSALAKAAGVHGFTLKLVPDFKAHEEVGTFDAAFCFEVLEHNHEPHAILDDVESWVRPGGRVFLSTPACAWSLHNDDTYRADYPNKEHIRVWTPKRTLAMLRSRGATDIDVRYEENPSIHENNGWTFSSYIPKPLNQK